MQSPFYRNPAWQNLANIGLAILVLIPLIALAFFNHPSAADDYCHIDTVFKYGWLDAMHYYYTGWSGRYFGVFLNHSNSLIFHSLAGFKLMPIAMYFGFIGAFYLLIQQINPSKHKGFNLGMAALLFYLFILKLPSIVEAFFWTAAVVNYTVQNIFLVLWMYFLLKREEYVKQGKPTGLLTGILFFLIFGINGGSENITLAMLLLLGAIPFYQIVFQRKLNWFYVIQLIWGIGCALFSLLAVGNAIRVAGNPQSRDFMFAFTESLKYTPSLLFDWISNPAFVLITALWISLLPRIVKDQQGNYNPYFKVNILYTTLLGIGLVMSQIFSSYYGIGIYPAPRIINCIYLYFLLAWFYNIGVLFQLLDQKKVFQLSAIPTVPLITKSLVGLLLVVNFYFSANPKLLYREWLGGEAAAYNAEMEARREILSSTTTPDTIYLQPLQHMPHTLYLEDMKDNPEHLWNRCIAGYFGKKAIYVGSPAPSQL